MGRAMNRAVSFLLFFAVACSLLGGIHYYLWVRLVRDMQLSAALEKGLTFVLVALFLSLPLTLVLGRALPREVADVLLRPTFAWMGIMWLLLVAVVGVDLLKLVVFAFQSLGADVVDSARRDALKRLFGLVALTLGGGAGVWALVEGYRFRIKRVEVALAKLPRSLDGTSIVQISDVHIGPTIGRGFLERVVATINSLNPDVIAITGDLVDGSVDSLRDAVAPLGALRSRHGTYFVTGNHEYYSGAASWCRHLSSLGVRVLRNECVTIGDGEHCYELAGVDDHSAAQFGDGHGANLAAALNSRNDARALVLLAHQPRAVHEAERMGVDLQLSGHTHGGQLWPFNWLVKLQQPVVSGLERVGRTLVYVSNGTGYWGPPMRLAAPAEITHIILRAPA